MGSTSSWDRFRKYLCTVPSLDLSLDVSRMGFDEGFLQSMETAVRQAYVAMDELEGGAIANPDENRMVGHYWLRAPEKAPTSELADEIRQSLQAVKSFAASVHDGQVKPPTAPKFTQVLSIGIGGFMLGPMFVGDALGHPDQDKMVVHFVDNTDPDGISRLLDGLRSRLSETLCIVISKSGGTPETRNGMLTVQAAFQAAQLDFARHSVAVTMPGSRLDQLAVDEGWLDRFAMFDWVGGRTSQLSAVGLLPAALQGLDVDSLLAGAAQCDEATRSHNTLRNPSMMMALMWYCATDGKGTKDIVVLPYKDRLLLFSRYLQQLIMESLGKQLDLAGNRVDQGISVYGNKGSTDQHAYVQQLRDGVNNFFVTFVRVLEAGGERVEVEPGVTVEDYLNGFLLGTREALSGNDRQSMTLTVPRIDARVVGALIALFERAVGFYASLININAYHQPGVEAGKKAAAEVLSLQASVLDAVTATPQSAEQIAHAIDATDRVEAVFLLLQHLAANGRVSANVAEEPTSATYTR